MDQPFSAYQGDDPYIFVSYSHADTSIVYPEIVWLQQCGFNVWWDEGISPGGRWSEELSERISQSSSFLFFITPNSVISQVCLDEAYFALDNTKPFLAVHLEETELPIGLDLRLGSRQAILKWQLAEAKYQDRIRETLSPGRQGSHARGTHLSPSSHRPGRSGSRRPAALPFSTLSRFFLENFTLLFRVLFDRTGLVNGIAVDSDDHPGMSEAVIYALFLSLLWIAAAFPFRPTGVNLGAPYLIAVTTITTATLFLFGLINHAVAKYSKGGATVQTSIIVSLYMSSILIVCPILMSFTPEIVTAMNQNPGEILGNLQAWIAQAGINPELVRSSYRPTPARGELFLLLMVVVVFLYWVYAHTRAIGRVHKLTPVRTLEFGLVTLITFPLCGLGVTEFGRNYIQSFIDPSPQTQLHSIAVLPFTVTVIDQPTQSFAVGLSEEIMVTLSRYKGLTVASRTASRLAFEQARDVRSMGADLAVAYVLEGSVSSGADLFRVTMQLIRVQDGHPVWTKSYDQVPRDGIETQQKVGRAIARHAKNALWLDVPGQRHADQRVLGLNLLALDYFLEAEKHYPEGVTGKGEDLSLYMEFLKRVTEVDRDAYPAYIHLSNLYARRLGNRLSIQDTVRAAHEVNTRAQQLQPGWPQPLLDLGYIHLNLDLDYASASIVFQQIINSDDPSFSFTFKKWAAYGLATIALRENRIDQAVALLNHPDSDYVWRNVWIQILSGNYQTAAGIAKKEFASTHDYRGAYSSLRVGAIAFALAGQIQEARPLITELWELWGSRRPENFALLFALTGRPGRARGILSDYKSDAFGFLEMEGSAAREDIAHAYILLGDNDQAFKIIEEGIRDHDAGIIDSLRPARFWDPIRDDPRYAEMLKLLDFKETHTEQYLKDNNIKQQPELCCS